MKEDLIRKQLLEIIKVGKLYHDPEEVIQGGLDIHELNELLDYQVRRKIIPDPKKILVGYNSILRKQPARTKTEHARYF